MKARKTQTHLICFCLSPLAVISLRPRKEIEEIKSVGFGKGYKKGSFSTFRGSKTLPTKRWGLQRYPLNEAF